MDQDTLSICILKKEFSNLHNGPKKEKKNHMLLLEDVVKVEIHKLYKLLRMHRVKGILILTNLESPLDRWVLPKLEIS